AGDVDMLDLGREQLRLTGVVDPLGVLNLVQRVSFHVHAPTNAAPIGSAAKKGMSFRSRGTASPQSPPCGGKTTAGRRWDERSFPERGTGWPSAHPRPSRFPSRRSR